MNGDQRQPEPPATPSGGRDPHFQDQGTTAEDRSGVGWGEEGYHASDYPGQNPLRGESEREYQRRLTYAWTWPRPAPGSRGESGRGSEADRRIRDAIGERILRAEPDLRRVVVQVLDGRVWLHGEVGSASDEEVVEGLAGSVKGVREVRSHLVEGGSGEGSGRRPPAAD